MQATRSKIGSNKNINQTRILLSVAAASVIAAGTSVMAADATWNVTSGAWNLGTNWTPAAAPGVSDGGVTTTNTDTATFGNKTSPTVTIDTDRNIFGINFSATSSAYTLSGGTLLLTNGGTIQTSGAGSAHTDTISTPLFLQGNGGAFNFTGGSSTATRLLVITGAVAGVSGASNVTTLNLNGTNTGTNVIGAGGISDGIGGGTLAIVKSGAGKWSLTGTNTFSGGVTLSAGTLGISSNRALADGSLTINGGVLDNLGGAAVSLRATTATTGNVVNGSATINTMASTAGLVVGQFVYGTGVQGGSYITAITPTSVTLSMPANGNAAATALAFGGTNAQTLAGDFTYAGSSQSLNLGNGAVSLGANPGAARTITVTANGLTIGGAISDGTDPTTPTRALIKNGAGSLGLYGASTYTGGTTINAGTVTLGNAASLGTGPLTINGGGISNPNVSLTLNNPTQFWNGNFSANATFTNSLNLGTGTVTLGNNITITTGNGTYGALVIAGGVIQNDSPSTPRSLTFLPGGSNPGGFSLAGANTYSGGTTVAGATLRIANVQGLGTGPLTLSGGAIQQGTGGLAVTGIPSIAITGDMSFSATSGPINLGTAPVTLTGARRLTVDNGGATFGGNFLGAGASLIYAGTSFSNSLNLNGAASSYDGGTLILGGGASTTLNAGGAAALGTGLVRLSPSVNSKLGVVVSNLTIDSLSSSIATPSFVAGTGSTNGTNIPLIFTGGGGTGAAGTVTVVGNAITGVNITDYGRDYTSAPTISFAGQGTGTVTSSYAASGVILGANTLTIVGTNASPATYAGVISGASGKVTKQGSGIQTLTGVSTYTGATTVTGGTLGIALAGNINTSSGVTLNGTGAVFKYDSSVGLTKPVTFGASGGTFIYNENTAGYSGGNLAVGAGATLGGSGKINGSVNATGGTISPGNSPGILSVGGNVTLGSGELEIELSKAGLVPVAGTDYDQLSATGAGSLVDLTGGDLALNVGAGLQANDLFFIVSNANTSGGTTGQFATLNGVIDPGLTGVGTFTVGGTTFAISYAADVAGGTFTGGNDVALQVVPEPATMALLGLGVIGLMGRRRERA